MSAEGSNKEMDNEQDNEFEKEQATKGAVLPEDVPTATVQPFEGEGKAKSTLKQADVTLQRLTTADLKPVEHYKAMDQHALKGAMEAIKTRLSDSEEVQKGPFVLSEIDHWDVAREKVVFTSKKNLYSIRFDFVSNTVYEIKTIPLAAIDEACYGDIAYPRFSMIKSHTGKALKMSWGKDYEPSFWERWNPFSTTIKHTVFQSHVLFQKGHASDAFLSVENFKTEVERAVAQGTENVAFKVQEGAVVIESYAGVAALVHNDSNLGFNKRRGGFDY